MDELIEAVLSTEAEGESEMLASLEGATDEQIELAKAHYRLQVGFQDKLSKDLFSLVAKSAGLEPEAPEAPEAEEAPEAPEADLEHLTENFLLSPEYCDALEVPEEIQKAIEAKELEIAELKKSADESAAKVVELEKAALRKSFVERVEKEFQHVAGASIDELADLLMDLGPLADRVAKTWASLESTKEILKTVGSVSRNDGVSETAMQRIEKAADELVSAQGITKAQAIAQVAKDKPDLYRAYKQEQRA